MKHTDLETGDGVIIKGRRAVVVAVETTGSQGFSFDYQDCLPSDQGRQHFFHPMDRMNEVEIDPNGPFSPYYTFACVNQGCACYENRRQAMQFTTMNRCPNCYGEIVKGTCHGFKHSAESDAAGFIEQRING